MLTHHRAHLHICQLPIFPLAYYYEYYFRQCTMAILWSFGHAQWYSSKYRTLKYHVNLTVRIRQPWYNMEIPSNNFLIRPYFYFTRSKQMVTTHLALTYYSNYSFTVSVQLQMIINTPNNNKTIVKVLFVHTFTHHCNCKLLHFTSVTTVL